MLTTYNNLIIYSFHEHDFELPLLWVGMLTMGTAIFDWLFDRHTPGI